MLDLRVLSRAGRAGETRAGLVDEDEAGIAGCDLGDGRACEERWRAGDDTDPWRSDGVIKLVNPARRTLLEVSSATGGMGEGAGVTDSLPPRRKLTLDSSLLSTPCLSLSFCKSSLSFPLPVLGVIVAKSSTGGVCFLDLVAVRMLCSREERRRVNGFVDKSSAAADDDEEGGCFEREDDAVGSILFGMHWWDAMGNGPETETLGNTAAAMYESNGTEMTLKSGQWSNQSGFLTGGAQIVSYRWWTDRT